MTTLHISLEISGDNLKAIRKFHEMGLVDLVEELEIAAQEHLNELILLAGELEDEDQELLEQEEDLSSDVTTE